MRRDLKVLCFLFAAFVATSVRAGPPFQTDDPEPIEYGHSEAYLFSTFERAPDGKSFQLPAFEFNTGPYPDLHLHLIVPFVSDRPNGGPEEYGLGDTEVGFKYRFVHESDYVPQIGIFSLVELPTGNAEKGLGNGRVFWSFPLWIQKSWGPWTTYGGGGRTFNTAEGARDFNFGGWLIQREITEKLTLGGEIFAQGAPTVDGQHVTNLNVGGYYKNMEWCFNCSLLFRVGHSVAGENQTNAYLGLYWTWGPTEEKPKRPE